MAESSAGRIRRHLTGNAIGYVALFFAMSGGAVALQGKNTVDSGDIINQQVKSADIRNDNIKPRDIRDDSLTGAEVALDSLGAADIAPGAIRASEIDAGAVEADEIAKDAVGADEIDDAEVQARIGGLCPSGSAISQVFSNGGVSCQDVAGGRELITTSSTFDSTSPKTAIANCTAGKVGVGGGARLSNSAGGHSWSGEDVALFANAPYLDDAGWIASALEPGLAESASWRVIAYAICLDLP